LISILVPIGIGGLGAVMIAATVFTLRHLARRRPHLAQPFNDDVSAESPSRISSVSTAEHINEDQRRKIVTSSLKTYKVECSKHNALHCE